MENAQSDLGKWLELSPNVLSYSVRHKVFFDLRMVIVRMSDDKLLVYSPLPDLPDSAITELKRLGSVGYILAPNHFHNLGIARFKAEFPAAKVYCGAAAKKRLGRVAPQDYRDAAELTPHLPKGVEVLVPPGVRTGEVWLSSGKTLVVCDSYFNFGPLPFGPIHLLLKLTGGAPGLRVSRVYRYMAVHNFKAYRSWVQDLLTRTPPQTLVPSHGHILSDTSLAGRLLALL